MKSWLRGHRFALRDVLHRFARMPFSTLFNVLVVGVALALPLLGATLVADLAPVTVAAAGQPEVSVFLAADTARADAAAMGPTLTGLPGVAGAQFVPRETALAALKKRPGMDAALSALSDNPLPDAWVVRLSPELVASPDAVAQEEGIAGTIRALPHVDRVLVDADWVGRLQGLARLTELALAVIALGLGAAVVGVLFNTVRLQVVGHREEMAVAALFGATRATLRRPFYYLGTLEGLAGGGLACALVWFALWPLNQALAPLARQYGSDFALAPPAPLLTAGFLLAAAFLGWLAAVLSVGQHLPEGVA